MELNIVILSGHSLFADGVASRLRQILKPVTLKVVNPSTPDAMTHLLAAQPSIIILDVTDTEAARFCSLSKLLRSLPDVKIIRLDPEQDAVQVVTSEQRPIGRVRDLLDVIIPSAGLSAA